MKLLFELNEKDSALIEKEKLSHEHILYCVPFDFHEDKRVEGYMVFTEKYIYKILDSVLLEKHALCDMCDFTVEILQDIPLWRRLAKSSHKAIFPL